MSKSNDDILTLGVVRVPTPEQSYPRMQRALARVDQLLTDIEPAIGHERFRAISDAVSDVYAAMQAAVTARLLAAIVAFDEGDNQTFVAPGVAS